MTVSLANKQRPSSSDYPFQRHAAKSVEPTSEVEDKARKLTRAILSEAAARASGRGGRTFRKARRRLVASVISCEARMMKIVAIDTYSLVLPDQGESTAAPPVSSKIAAR